jgi:hypothetical protein
VAGPGRREVRRARGGPHSDKVGMAAGEAGGEAGGEEGGEAGG